MQFVKAGFPSNLIVGLVLVLASIGIACGFQTPPPPPPPPVDSPKVLPIPFMHKELVSILVVIPPGQTFDFDKVDLSKITCVYHPLDVSLPDVNWTALKVRKHKKPEYVTVVFMAKTHEKKKPKPAQEANPQQRTVYGAGPGSSTVTITVPTSGGGSTPPQQYPVDDNVESD